VKREVRIAMRDGAQLFTSIYVPRDTSRAYPIMMSRTPYGVAPYGDTAYKAALGPSKRFQDEGFIFVYQDTRRYMSRLTTAASARAEHLQSEGVGLQDGTMRIHHSKSQPSRLTFGVMPSVVP
jgi:hypothetical protein